jgi:flagellin-like hook-associated protein FlgL
MDAPGMLGRINAETALLRARMETQLRQAATGQRGERLGDLAPEVPRALSLRAEIGRREAYDKAMGQALGRTAAMQDALGRMGEIAQEIRTRVVMRIDPADPSTLATARAQARAALQEIAGLLNARHAGEYLFAGSDLANPPVPDPQGIADGPLAVGIAAEVASLAPGNAAAVLQATRGLAQSDAAGVSPFSPWLEDPAGGAAEERRVVPSADGEAIAYGLFANRNAAASSRGDTTGAWARDLLRSLMTLAALTPAQMAAGADFSQVTASVRDGLRSAEDSLAEERGSLGAAERRIESARRRHEAVTGALRSQLSSVEEVDLAEALTRLQGTRSALEASYRAMGALAELSLARFLR